MRSQGVYQSFGFLSLSERIPGSGRPEAITSTCGRCRPRGKLTRAGQFLGLASYPAQRAQSNQSSADGDLLSPYTFAKVANSRKHLLCNDLVSAQDVPMWDRATLVDSHNHVLEPELFMHAVQLLNH